MEAASMGKKPSKPRRVVLRLRDLDHSKSAVLNSLGSPASRRAYEFAIDEFIAWYCSEPRLAFSRVVVARYRLSLEARGLAASSINQRLAAVRRLAYEAADGGLGRAHFTESHEVIARAFNDAGIGFRVRWMELGTTIAVPL
jgi:hypothetical protein